jgi:hypothetical protein
MKSHAQIALGKLAYYELTPLIFAHNFVRNPPKQAIDLDKTASRLDCICALGNRNHGTVRMASSLLSYTALTHFAGGPTPRPTRFLDDVSFCTSP